MTSSLDSITSLPHIEELRCASQSVALLDAIVMPEWEYRYFSFNNNWDGSRNEMMASMRDGSGGEYFINFTNRGAVGKVLSDSRVSQVSDCLDVIPSEFSGFKTEPAFNITEASFFFWRLNDELNWNASPENLTGYPFLGLLAGGAIKYHRFAEEYYEKSIDFSVLEKVYNTLEVDSKSLKILNPELALDDLSEDFEEIL